MGELKNAMDKALSEQRNLIQLHFFRKFFFRREGTVLLEVETQLQKVHIERIG